MAIKLTESRLRQIVREEVANLPHRNRRPSRRLREGVSDESDAQARSFGLTHYIDYSLDVYPDELGGAGVGENVAEYLADLIPELGGAISGTEDIVVMINPKGPSGGLPVFRFYGDRMAMTFFAEAFGEMENGPPHTDLIKRIKSSRTMMDT